MLEGIHGIKSEINMPEFPETFSPVKMLLFNIQFLAFRFEFFIRQTDFSSLLQSSLIGFYGGKKTEVEVFKGFLSFFLVCNNLRFFSKYHTYIPSLGKQ